MARAKGNSTAGDYFGELKGSIDQLNFQRGWLYIIEQGSFFSNFDDGESSMNLQSVDRLHIPGIHCTADLLELP